MSCLHSPFFSHTIPLLCGQCSRFTRPTFLLLLLHLFCSYFFRMTHTRKDNKNIFSHFTSSAVVLDWWRNLGPKNANTPITWFASLHWHPWPLSLVSTQINIHMVIRTVIRKNKADKAYFKKSYIKGIQCTELYYKSWTCCHHSTISLHP